MHTHIYTRTRAKMLREDSGGESGKNNTKKVARRGGLRRVELIFIRRGRTVGKRKSGCRFEVERRLLANVSGKSRGG